jgi:haloacetate dehalogenase
MWHRVAPRLAEHLTVVCADLRGYGASGKPDDDREHRAYARRTMAADQVRLMRALGFARFHVAGHDRGGRVTHRLALDHADAVLSAAVLDIVPTLTTFRRMNAALALDYYHWLFLAQPAPLPERLIGADPVWYLHRTLGGWGSGGLGIFAPEALALYEQAFREPATIAATCADYRAAATIDLADDEADLERRIEAPLLVMWGTRAVMHRHFDVAATWRERARAVTAVPVEAGHFLAEEQPGIVADALLRHVLG